MLWLTPSVDDAEISLRNFTVFRADRVQTRRGGGGVAFYIKSSLKPVRLQLGMEAPPPGIETIWGGSSSFRSHPTLPPPGGGASDSPGDKRSWCSALRY